MKNRMFIIAVILSAVFCWPASWSIENPGIGNPVGPSTIPPSTISSGLVNSSAPIDTDGNLLITGNVRRGRHFRGDVPYRSPTSFGSSLGSSALNSFLRDTAGPEDFQTYSSKYGTQPYYSPTETVTTMLPGRSGIFIPERTGAGTRVQQDARSEAADAFRSDSMTQEQTLFNQASSAADSRAQASITQYGPLAQSRLMLESKFPTSMTKSPQSTELFKPAHTELRDGQWEKNESFRFPNQQMNNESLRPAFEIQTSGQNRNVEGKRNALTRQGDSPLEQFQPSMDSISQRNLLSQKNTNWSDTSKEFQLGKEQTSAAALDGTKGVTSSQTETGQDWEQREVLERIRQQLDDLTKSLDAAMLRRDGYKDVSVNPAAERREKPLGYQSYLSDSSRAVPGERVNSGDSLNYYGQQGTELGFKGEELAPTVRRGLNRSDTGMQAGLDFKEMPDYTNSQKRNSPLDELNKLSQAEISAEASRIMGSHNSLESLSRSKFNQHMLDAEEHLRAGRYYHAASSFSLASVYQPDNPLALAGRGHALFAAGEYVSSALFLSRALDISPEYLQMKVDFAAMLGDERKLAGSIADIEQWLARSGSSQLQFLLGYVYYRTGQFLRAKQAIDAAYEKTPQLPSVQAMKITLDNMMMQR